MMPFLLGLPNDVASGLLRWIDWVGLLACVFLGGLRCCGISVPGPNRPAIFVKHQLTEPLEKGITCIHHDHHRRILCQDHSADNAHLAKLVQHLTAKATARATSSSSLSAEESSETAAWIKEVLVGGTCCH